MTPPGTGHRTSPIKRVAHDVCAKNTACRYPAAVPSKHLVRTRCPRLAMVPDMGAELIRVGDTSIRFLVEGADSGGSAAVFEAGIRAHGRMPAPHSHDGFEETVYGLEGVATWTIDGTAVDVVPGEAGGIPRGAVHHFDNHGEPVAKVLAIITPGVLGPDYFREVAAVFADSSGGPPDLARIGEVMRRHGLTPAAPPTG